MAAPSYPLAHPSTPGFIQSRWSLQRAVGHTMSPFSGNQQVQEYDLALWKASITLPPMKRSQASDWVAFFVRLHGRRGTFALGDPDGQTLQGVCPSATLSSNVAVGDFDLPLSVGNVSASGTYNDAFKAGDYVQLGSGGNRKLYMVVATVNASSGALTLEVEPRLKAAGSSGDTVVLASTKCIMRMDTNELGWDADHVSKYGLSFSCTEAI